MRAPLELDGLSGFFGGQRVLGPLSLTIAPGEKIALVGKSGAGKSTLVRLIHDRVGDMAALVPQELGLVNALPVFHNVFMARLDQHNTLYNLVTLLRPFRADRDAITGILEQLDMADKLWSSAARLSGGQRQRTAIARALFREADLLLADEPVSALDGPLAHAVMGLLRERFDTFVVALHDVELALTYSTRVVGIQGGEIALDAASDSLTAADIRPLYD
ncbi:ATP-binding cassette domain-containing protein [Marinobacter zhanjiangensis]|uniref:Phosphonates import ATP-binding protein PhnC 1 n=1 Tax=Marinobacter zhanjiangensis TaxID=578215 RepID=A0ABQ3AVK8_9GAMM|nr:ATP-binding cassette domain-containing protein [Marinobacter zhanjiangensis]GGY67454.1 phosphonates import ATP-binding protein PhnC 1 [Marinobacter zhanjiangensis]